MNTPLLNPGDVKCDREVWAVPDGGAGQSGSGTKSNPYRTPTLDALMPLIGNSVRLHLGPGVYMTRMWRNPDTFVCDDGGTGGVTIQSAIGSPGRAGNNVRMFGDNTHWSRYFFIRGVTLDGNWSDQPLSTGGNFKVEPLAVQAYVAQVRDCLIKGWGSSSANLPADRKLEAFPLRLDSFASGDLDKYDPRYVTLKTTEPSPTRLEIIDNQIEAGVFSGGGYGTCVFFQTAQGAALGDRQPFGTRTNEAALASGNHIRCPGGIGLGGGGLSGGGLEAARFEDNDVIDTKCAFNMDTGQLANVTIRNNRFHNVSQGPNITPTYRAIGVAVHGNVIELGAPFFNSVLNRNEDLWGIRGGNMNSGCVASRNTIITPANWPGTVLSGIGDVNNRVISIAVPASNGELQTALGRIDVLQKQLIASDVDRNSAIARSLELEKAIAGVRAALEKV